MSSRRTHGKAVPDKIEACVALDIKGQVMSQAEENLLASAFNEDMKDVISSSDLERLITVDKLANLYGILNIVSFFLSVFENVSIFHIFKFCKFTILL